MKLPEKPPDWNALRAEFLHSPERLFTVLRERPISPLSQEYPHWQQLKHHSPPGDLTLREWWFALKTSRGTFLKNIDLRDKQGEPFKFSVPESVLERLHRIDLGGGGLVNLPAGGADPAANERYLVGSLIEEEAITSSQLEGAVTTREVAKEMLRTGRSPIDNSERMILNNYKTMRLIRDVKAEPLTPELVLKIHGLVTEKTLKDSGAAGRLRRPDEVCIVGDDEGKTFHDPPYAAELPARMEAMCAFANAETPFIHPVVRAIILHFWLAYDHPFVDGNGRTARALFYWAMLHRGYWLFEFISISNILRKAPVKYYRSFLRTETDDNDLTYFIVAQSRVIQQAIDELRAYIERKTRETREAESRIRALLLFNHRQSELLRRALIHPGEHYTFAGHQKTHGVAYQTARTDLNGLADRGLLQMRVRGKQQIFLAPPDLAERLKKMEEELGGGL